MAQSAHMESMLRTSQLGTQVTSPGHAALMDSNNRGRNAEVERVLAEIDRMADEQRETARQSAMNAAMSGSVVIDPATASETLLLKQKVSMVELEKDELQRGLERRFRDHLRDLETRMQRANDEVTLVATSKTREAADLAEQLVAVQQQLELLDTEKGQALRDAGHRERDLESQRSLHENKVNQRAAEVVQEYKSLAQRGNERAETAERQAEEVRRLTMEATAESERVLTQRANSKILKLKEMLKVEAAKREALSADSQRRELELLGQVEVTERRTQEQLDGVRGDLQGKINMLQSDASQAVKRSHDKELTMVKEGDSREREVTDRANAVVSEAKDAMHRAEQKSVAERKELLAHSDKARSDLEKMLTDRSNLAVEKAQGEARSAAAEQARDAERLKESTRATLAQAEKEKAALLEDCNRRLVDKGEESRRALEDAKASFEMERQHTQMQMAESSQQTGALVSEYKDMAHKAAAASDKERGESHVREMAAAAEHERERSAAEAQHRQEMQAMQDTVKEMQHALDSERQRHVMLEKECSDRLSTNANAIQAKCDNDTAALEARYAAKQGSDKHALAQYEASVRDKLIALEKQFREEAESRERRWEAQTEERSRSEKVMEENYKRMLVDQKSAFERTAETREAEWRTNEKGVTAGQEQREATLRSEYSRLFEEAERAFRLELSNQETRWRQDKDMATAQLSGVEKAGIEKRQMFEEEVKAKYNAIITDLQNRVRLNEEQHSRQLMEVQTRSKSDEVVTMRRLDEQKVSFEAEVKAKYNQILEEHIREHNRQIDENGRVSQEDRVKQDGEHRNSMVTMKEQMIRFEEQIRVKYDQMIEQQRQGFEEEDLKRRRECEVALSKYEEAIRLKYTALSQELEDSIRLQATQPLPPSALQYQQQAPQSVQQQPLRSTVDQSFTGTTATSVFGPGLGTNDLNMSSALTQQL